MIIEKAVPNEKAPRLDRPSAVEGFGKEFLGADSFYERCQKKRIQEGGGKTFRKSGRTGKGWKGGIKTLLQSALCLVASRSGKRGRIEGMKDAKR